MGTKRGYEFSLLSNCSNMLSDRVVSIMPYGLYVWNMFLSLMVALLRGIHIVLMMGLARLLSFWFIMLLRGLDAESVTCVAFYELVAVPLLPGGVAFGAVLSSVEKPFQVFGFYGAEHRVSLRDC